MASHKIESCFFILFQLKIQVLQKIEKFLILKVNKFLSSGDLLNHFLKICNIVTNLNTRYIFFLEKKLLALFTSGVVALLFGVLTSLLRLR